MTDNKLETVNLGDIRVISFDKLELRIVLSDHSEVSFKFATQDQLTEALESLGRRIGEAKTHPPNVVPGSETTPPVNGLQ